MKRSCAHVCADFVIHNTNDEEAAMLRSAFAVRVTVYEPTADCSDTRYPPQCHL